MTRVAIVGVGLIGGSLGMALRRARRNGRRLFHVTGLGRRASQLRLAKKMGAVDEVAFTARQGLSKADIVVICVPVPKIVPILKKSLPFLKSGAIVTDVGSVKGSVVRGSMQVLSKRRRVSFVGAHPIAGSEKTGVVHARADLFKRATCVVTKDHASASAIRSVKKMWERAGSQCVLLNATEHDRWLALTSHLPHLLAFSLFSQVSSASKRHPVLRRLVAGSFRDMTRIVGSNPEIWTGIVESNRAEISKAVESFHRSLRFFSRAPSRPLGRTLARIAREKTRW